MQCRLASACALVAALTLFGGGRARADYTYTLSLTTPSNDNLIRANPNGNNAVVVTPGPNGGNASEFTLATVDSLIVQDGNGQNFVENYNGVGWGITVHLDDSGETDDLTFSAVLDGVLGDPSQTLTNTFSDATRTSKVIGGNLYTLSVVPSSVTLPQSSGVQVTFKASVTVQDDPGQGTPPAQTTPEPASLVLAGLALPALGLRCWRRRGTGRAPASPTA